MQMEMRKIQLSIPLNQYFKEQFRVKIFQSEKIKRADYKFNWVISSNSTKEIGAR
ncbi:hypothetical protein SAMN05216524_101658 [Mucilaginibacter sp. OK098]|nr:hypothetical protein SAMN05216524_101658 [Mucilaginibacter sp. OK098]